MEQSRQKVSVFLVPLPDSGHAARPVFREVQATGFKEGLASAPQCAAGLSLPAHTQSLRGDNGHQSWGNLQLLLRKKEAGPWRKPATYKGRAQHQLEQGGQRATDRMGGSCGLGLRCCHRPGLAA